MSHNPRLWEAYRQQIEALGERKANFDLEREHEKTEAFGWRVDSYVAELPPEPPGDPLPHGSWQIAREVIANYEFPDPRLITGIYVPDGPLEGRAMLLRGRFLFFTFYFGVRVGRVIDETREVEGHPARVWGFAYHTLEGHFEMGQATFTIWKHLDTGRIEFRFNAYSKTAHIKNIFYRIGFKLFGRTLQKRFAQQIQVRMQRIVSERLAAARTAMPEPVVEAPAVKPLAGEKQEKLDEIKDKAQNTPPT